MYPYMPLTEAMGAEMDDDSVTAVNCAEVSVFYTDGEILAQNILSFRHTIGTITTAELKQLAITVNTWHKTEVMPFLSAEIESNEAIALDLTTFPNPVRSSFPTIQVSGESADAIPMVCVARFDFITSLSGVWYTGHNYVSGIPRNMVIKSHIDTTWLDGVQVSYSRLPDYVGATGWEWSVISKRLGGELRPAGLITPIQSVSWPDNRVRTWRQRIARYGS